MLSDAAQWLSAATTLAMSSRLLLFAPPMQSTNVSMTTIRMSRSMQISLSMGTCLGRMGAAYSEQSSSVVVNSGMVSVWARDNCSSVSPCA